MKNPINKTAKPLGILNNRKFKDFGGSVTYDFQGDIELARSHTGVAQSFVKNVADLMEYADLQALKLSKTLNDNTIISVFIVMNHATVEINAPFSRPKKKRRIKEKELGPEWIKIRDIWCTGGERGYFFGGGDFGNNQYEIALLFPKYKQGFDDYLLLTSAAAEAGDYPAGTKTLFTCQVATPGGDVAQLLPDPGYAESNYMAVYGNGGYESSKSIYLAAMAFASMPTRMTAGILFRQEHLRLNPVETGGFHVTRDPVFGIGLGFIGPFHTWAEAYPNNVLVYSGNGEPNAVMANDIHVLQPDAIRFRFGGDAQFPVAEDADIIQGAVYIPWLEERIRVARIGYDFSDNDMLAVCTDASSESLFYSNYSGFDWEVGFSDLISISKRMYGVIVGSVAKSALHHTDGDVSYYKSYASFKLRVAQVEDDGTVNTTFLSFVSSDTFSPDDNTHCYWAPSGASEFTYLPCGYDVVCAPKNTALLCKDRQTSLLTVAGSTGPTTTDCIAIVTRLVTGISWSVVQPTGIKANVAAWAKDGSAFISRRWLNQKYCRADIFEGEYTFRLEQKYDDPIDSEMYSYDLYLFNGETFVNALTIRPMVYPPTDWANIGNYMFFYSENMETIVITGSSNANGIYKKEPLGTLTTLFSGQDGFEPIFISPDGRCVATNTKIFIDGIQVATPTRCAGVFFDYGAFMDYEPGTEELPGPGLCIKTMATGDVITSAGPEYNFWELAADSSAAVCSRFYRDAELESSAPARLLIVDFANGPYKFETTDQALVFHFPLPGTPVPFATPFYLFPDIYGKTDEDGIPFGCRYWGVSEVNSVPEYALVYTAPPWAYNCYWFSDVDQWHGIQAYDATTSAMTSDTNNITGPSNYQHRKMVDWPTGHHTGPAVCHTYSDAYDKRKSDSNYLDKRIYSHLFHWKVGIMERVWDGMGEIPEEYRTISKTDVTLEEV